jgi:anti-sigma B factor antagonist
MKIQAENYGHAVVLIVDGELTVDTLEAFMQAVEHQLEDGSVIDIAINAENLAFADSAGLEMLLDLQDRLAERLGQVKFIKPDENLRKILDVTRLEPMFEILEDTNEALKAVQA